MHNARWIGLITLAFATTGTSPDNVVLKKYQHIKSTKTKERLNATNPL
jgi:hypothetical protein